MVKLRSTLCLHLHHEMHGLYLNCVRIRISISCYKECIGKVFTINVIKYKIILFLLFSSFLRAILIKSISPYEISVVEFVVLTKDYVEEILLK